MTGTIIVRRVRDPVTTRAQLKLIYDIRSRVVHDGLQVKDAMGSRGKKSTKPSMNVSQLVLEAEDIVRYVIRAYIDAMLPSRSIAEVNQDLEDAILVGMSRT